EVIIRLLEAVERRIRGNRIFNEAAAGLSVALLLPVGFKSIDLIFPFRGITVAVFFGVWGIATAIGLLWRTRGRNTLEQAAANIDLKADAHDEIKRAYWFIRNPKPSELVGTQVRRAAQNANRMQVE